MPRNGELRGGERWDRLSAAWVPADEWQRRQWDREDRAFARKANQGDLATPMVIGDSHKPVQSMVTGRMHDSKSTLRREYREHGVVEVGNDVPTKRGKSYRRPEAENKLTFDALKRAKADLDIPSDFKVYRDPEGMERLRRQGKI